MYDGWDFLSPLTPNLQLSESKLGPYEGEEENGMGTLKDTFDSGLTKFTCSGYFGFHTTSVTP